MAFTGVTLAKPGTVGDIALAADLIGRTTGDDFRLKIKRFDVEFNTVVADTTGDGDLGSGVAVTRVEHNEMLYGQGVITGFLLSGSNLDVGIRNLIDPDKNPLQSAPGTIDPLRLFLHSTTRYIEFGCLIESIRIFFDADMPFVGVELRVHVSGSEPTDA